MSKNLKPCPFCGRNQHKQYAIKAGLDVGYVVACIYCGGRAEGRIPDEAVEQWNTRAQPTHQHQSGPLTPYGWHVEWADSGDHYLFTKVKKRIEALRLDSDVKVVQLYACADPVEVELLREQLAAWQTMAAERLEMVAERDALLKSVIEEDSDKYVMGDEWHARYEQLSVSAEQSAPSCITCNDHGAVGNILDTVPCPDYAAAPPVALDERAAFERVVVAEWAQAPISRKRDLLPKDDPCYGDYCDEPLQRAWVGWRMRAWLEGSRLTVLSKCVLCDQLQVDLTERDEEVDRLRTTIAKVRKTICLPNSIESLLDSAMEQQP